MKSNAINSLIVNLLRLNTSMEANDFGFGYVYEYTIRFVQENPEFSELEDCFAPFIDENMAKEQARHILETGTLMQLSNAVGNLYKARVYRLRPNGGIRNIDNRDIENLISDIIAILRRGKNDTSKE